MKFLLDDKHKIKAEEYLRNINLYSRFSNLNNYYILPGFCDVHVHFREPGFLYKESILTGSRAAAHGGYTAVLTMPNLNPVPDNIEHLTVQTDIIKKQSLINIYPYGSISINEEGKMLSDLEALSNYVIAFSDDGRGVQNSDLMKKAMTKCKSLNKIIVAHCEDNSLINGGIIHEGEYAKLHNYKGISSKSEYMQLQRDIELVRETGCKYHACHISTKESVEIIRQAKKDGLDVSCETAPHYLCLSEEDINDDGAYKMNPPLRSIKDKEALINGIVDGTIDMIATDHAPHSKEEKSKGLKGSLNGIIGLETAFPVLYTDLVLKHIISLEELINLLSINPKKRFGIFNDDFCLFEMTKEYTIDEKNFLSKGKSSPFIGKRVRGQCILTICDNKNVYNSMNQEDQNV